MHEEEGGAVDKYKVISKSRFCCYEQGSKAVVRVYRIAHTLSYFTLSFFLLCPMTITNTKQVVLSREMEIDDAEHKRATTSAHAYLLHALGHYRQSLRASRGAQLRTTFRVREGTRRMRRDESRWFDYGFLGLVEEVCRNFVTNMLTSHKCALTSTRAGDQNLARQRR